MSFPALPLEITIKILECAALNEYEETWRFFVISRAMSQFLEPTLYTSVVLLNHSKAEAFLRNLQARPSRVSYVIALLCCYGMGHGTVLEVVTLCSNIRRLGHWASDDGEEVREVLAAVKQPLLSLSTYFGDYRPDLSSAPFQSLQYLDICDYWDAITWHHWREEWEHLGSWRSLYRLSWDRIVFFDRTHQPGQLIPEDRKRAIQFRDTVRQFVLMNDGVDSILLLDANCASEAVGIVVHRMPETPALRHWWSHTVGDDFWGFE